MIHAGVAHFPGVAHFRPLMAQSGHSTDTLQCPLSGVKRTLPLEAINSDQVASGRLRLRLEKNLLNTELTGVQAIEKPMGLRSITRLHTYLDLLDVGPLAECPLSGGRQTWRLRCEMSANDPKRTLNLKNHRGILMQPHVRWSFPRTSARRYPSGNKATFH
jgi:hypothetical protein